MNLDELISKFDAVIGNLEGIVSEEVVTIAEDGLVLVDRRVTREGKRADGSAFPRYDPAYEAFKKREGKYRGIVDLTFTGQMWKNTRIVKVVKTPDRVQVVVAGGDKFTQDKMDNNADLRGDFLTLSPKEIQQLVEDSEERLGRKINFE